MPKIFRRRIRVIGDPPISFTWKAFAALVLYWIFWFPGLTATIMFLNEAKAEERRLGYAPHGMTLLRFLLWSNIFFLMLAIVAVMWMLERLGIKVKI